MRQSRSQAPTERTPNMKYTIHGRKFSKEHHYYGWDSEHKYPTFDIIDEVVITREANSLDEAYDWMLRYIPEYAIGCSIFSEDKNSFALHPVKDYYACLPELPDLEQKTLVEYELKCLRGRRAG